MIRGSDGLDYEDLTARLLGEPLRNIRNGNIQCYRANPRWTEAQVRRYVEAFDSTCPEGDPGPSAKFADAHQAGLYAAGVSLLRGTSGVAVAIDSVS